MKSPVDRSAQRKSDDIIVVKLWENFLRMPAGSVSGVISESSIDNGPFERGENQRITFRFTRPVWEDKIRGILYEHRIPVVIQSNPLYALQTRGELARQF